MVSHPDHHFTQVTIIGRELDVPVCCAIADEPDQLSQRRAGPLVHCPCWPARPLQVSQREVTDVFKEKPLPWKNYEPEQRVDELGNHMHIFAPMERLLDVQEVLLSSF